MKRLILSGLALIAIAALALGGNRLLQTTLDARLPGLLSDELGIAVSLAPTRTSISRLSVYTPKLVMGDPANPALTATDVAVSLDLSDLLHGQLRLRRASGRTLVIKPSLWPTNDDPWPSDYRFLDPYLPDRIQLESARYIGEDDSSYTFTDPEWRRQAPAASLGWRDTRNEQVVDVTLSLDSLDDLLRLAGLKGGIAAIPAAEPASRIDVALDIAPRQPAGYTLAAQLTAADLKAQLSSTAQDPWELPGESTTHIEKLDIGALQALLTAYGAAAGDSTSTGAMLASTLPRLRLPEHKGQITVAEIRWKDEVVLDSELSVTTGRTGVAVPAFSAHGAGGSVRGDASVLSSDDGWQIDARADIVATESGHGLGDAYLDADWLWRNGSVKLKGEGTTVGDLLNDLEGNATIAGIHRGENDTPIELAAELGHSPGVFALEGIDIRVGEGRITGSATLSDEDRRRLTARVKAEHLDLNFLLPSADSSTEPGLPMPEFLDALPGVDMDWQVEAVGLRASSVNIDRANLTLTRSEQRSKFSATAHGAGGGSVDVELTAGLLPQGGFDVTLQVGLSSFDIPKLFRQAPGVIDSRTSGSVSFTSQGQDVAEVFEAMRGSADLNMDFRPDHDWKRAPQPDEQLRLRGNADLVVENNRLAGLHITELAADSLRQNLSGKLSMIDGRDPWLVAELESEQLDIARLREFGARDESGSDASDDDDSALQSLKKLGSTRFSLHAKSMALAGATLSDVVLNATTSPDNIDVTELDFALDQGRLTSKGSISWQRDTATLAVEAKVRAVALGSLLSSVSSVSDVPLSGSISLRSSGSTLTELLAGLNGDIALSGDEAGSAGDQDAAARIAMTAYRTESGMRADIEQFRWRGSELSGTVEYHDRALPLVEIHVSGGSLSLLPWEAGSTDAKAAKAKKTDSSVITRTAKAGASLVGDILMAPFRLVSGPSEAAPGEKLFSNTPLPFEWPNTYEARIKGVLGTVTSVEAVASDLTFSASLIDGKLNAEASADKINEGTVSIKASLDLANQLDTLALSGTFSNIRGNTDKPSFPRSGYFNVTSRGHTQAELAANISGVVYLELGKGPLDYDNVMLLTADVASSAFRALIPGIEKQQAELECAATLGIFTDGIGTTPYGYAARTRQANLVGRVELDLKKELVHLNFSSSSRKGVGLSVGSVFSNTVEVEGPLTDPKIIPNTTGLLWRSWAAVLTGGLSVVGESVLKRALASENPCAAVRKHIHKDFCGSGAPGAAEAPAMVCPAS